MTKSQLVKVRALFYLLLHITKRGCAFFDTAPHHLVSVGLLPRSPVADGIGIAWDEVDVCAPLGVDLYLEVIADSIVLAVELYGGFALSSFRHALVANGAGEVQAVGVAECRLVCTSHVGEIGNQRVAPEA